MGISYPPQPPVLTGDVLSANRFMASPTLILRQLRTIAQQRFVGDMLLSSRFQVSGGAVLYEQNENIYSDRSPQAVAPGAEYPLTTIGTGPAQLAKVDKWGQDSLITDESIKRAAFDPINRALTKQVNQLVKTIDGFTMSAIASQVTQTMDATGGAGSGNWTAGTPKILADVLKAVATIRALNQGYEPDTVVVDDLTWAAVMSDDKIANLLPRENGSAPVQTGDFPVVAGLRWLRTPNLPVGGKALVLDSRVLGGMADEQLGGPGYVTSDGAAGIEVKTMRDDENDQWRIRARRVTVPVITEPNAAIFINKV
ncbi:DUF2184 domain-containing protein [Rhodococcus sp. D2-41]|uniref:phage major capsid protein n=1 Tax=Speluncibacter jeojiensis TaxID=2710754 RepID=UPI00240EBCAD|nr:hypothetical protein [Rhodococcus sp. D2-41]MDG3012152.1 DUF2184 domain-containing protein [Rhodococcus sp. D2-41]